MRDDPVLGRIVAVTGAPATGGGAASTELQPLLVAMSARGDVTAAWLAHWRRLWPAGGATRRGLESIIVAVRRAAAALAASDTATATSDALDALRATLLRSFRRHPLAPEAAVAYLGLEALDLLELRGAVTRRAALSAEAT